jgi:hypothetical protein
MSESASVEVLAAEVRVVQVGSLQLTRSMYDYESVPVVPSITGSWSGGPEWDTSAEWQRGVGSAESDQPPPSDEDLASFRTALEAQDTEAAAAADSALPSAQTICAVVNADGTLARGFGAFSSRRLFEGTYQVISTGSPWRVHSRQRWGETTAPACPFLDLW